MRMLLLVLLALNFGAGHMAPGTPPDWLVTKVTNPTTLTKTPQGTLLLSNGLIAREFGVTPDFFTIDYFSYEKNSSLLRAVGPEAQVC